MEGRTEYAAWQPGTDPQYAYVYRRGQWGRLTQTSRGVRGAFRTLATGGPGMDEPETVQVVFRWVQTMVFDSHLPTRRFAQLAAKPGITVRRTMLDGRPWVCIRYDDGEVALNDCLEGDPRGGEVLTERLRVGTSEAGGVWQSFEVETAWAPAPPVAAIFRSLRASSFIRTRGFRSQTTTSPRRCWIHYVYVELP